LKSLRKLLQQVSRFVLSNKTIGRAHAEDNTTLIADDEVHKKGQHTERVDGQQVQRAVERIVPDEHAVLCCEENDRRDDAREDGRDGEGSDNFACDIGCNRN
jgi:hypothetical protein